MHEPAAWVNPGLGILGNLCRLLTCLFLLIGSMALGPWLFKLASGQPMDGVLFVIYIIFLYCWGFKWICAILAHIPVLSGIIRTGLGLGLALCLLASPSGAWDLPGRQNEESASETRLPVQTEGKLIVYEYQGQRCHLFVNENGMAGGAGAITCMNGQGYSEEFTILIVVETNKD